MLAIQYGREAVSTTADSIDLSEREARTRRIADRIESCSRIALPLLFLASTIVFLAVVLNHSEDVEELEGHRLHQITETFRVSS